MLCGIEWVNNYLSNRIRFSYSFENSVMYIKIFEIYKWVLIFFLCAMFFWILHILKNSPSLVFKCPPKSHHTTYSFYNQQCCLVSYWILFICAPFTGKGFLLERLGISLERQRLSRSKLEWCKIIKALNKVMISIFPGV